MTQKCIKCIVAQVLFELDCLEYERNLLDIAVEQCESESKFIADRVEILVTSYLEHTSAHIEYLRDYLENIASVAEVSCIDISVDELKF